MKIIPIIGLEVHLELKTKSKMFCSCSAAHFQAEPNSQTCPVCLGFPGTLPVPNQTAIDWCLKLGLALNCRINQYSYFERKNYFYPDLPKGYQISQLHQPFAVEGFLEIEGQKIRLNRVHLEEDSGRCLRQNGQIQLDFNRAGVPLIEIVSEPDLTSLEIVKKFLSRIQQIARYLDVADADIEKGSMRCEPTVNLKIEEDDHIFYTPLVEIKNIAGLGEVAAALDFEINRQQKEFTETRQEKDKPPAGGKTTRGWNAGQKRTFLQREKEEVADYRYFPEPDIPPFEFSEEYIEKIRQEIPELPDQKIKNYLNWGLSQTEAEIMSYDRNFALCFEKAVGNQTKLAKSIANLFLGPLKFNLDLEKINPIFFHDLIKALNKNEISATVAKQIILESYQTGKNPLEIAKERNLFQNSDIEDLKTIAQKVLADNPQAVADYRKNPNSIGFLIGQLMKVSAGRANPQLARQVLEELLK